MIEMTRLRVNRIEKEFGISCLMAVCLMTASVPASLAKKSGFKTQEGSAYIPAGTTLNVRMIDELDTGKTQPGDSFRASLDKPVVVDGRTVASKDALVRGTVTDVVSSGRLKRPASLTLKLTQVTLSSGRMVPVETSPYTLDGKSHNLRNAALIGGGAAAGGGAGGSRRWQERRCHRWRCGCRRWCCNGLSYREAGDCCAFRNWVSVFDRRTRDNRVDPP